MNFTSLVSLTLLGLVGCSTTALDDSPGQETGPCVDAQCFAGLSCRSGLCVDASGGEAASEAADEATGDESEDGVSGPANTETSTTAAADGASETSAGTTTTSGGQNDAATAPVGDSGDSQDTLTNGEEGFNFLEEPTGGTSGPCSIWEQDCPAGEKCNAWASGGSMWDATLCVQVVPFPDEVGEPCEVESSAASGFDTCVEGAMCWSVDPETLSGECVAYCGGSIENPQCPPSMGCAVNNSGVLAVCVPLCDPLVQNCPADEGCYPVDTEFLCIPDASNGADYGDACGFINGCAAGNACLAPSFVGACLGATGCCSPYCDLGQANNCPAVGQECVAVYTPGAEPPGFENLGWCGIP